MSDRDSQFSGFAKRLWDELIEANGYDYIDVNKWDDDGVDPTNYRQIISRSAYYLVEHTVSNFVPRGMDAASRKQLIVELAQTIPDLEIVPIWIHPSKE
jgi:hypothetical protein